MRPMPNLVDNSHGSWFPKDQNVLPIDTRLSNIPQTVVKVRASGAGFGLVPGYGTYIEIGHTNYDVHRFYNTRPMPVIQLRPQMNGLSKQVTAANALLKQPGYTTNLSYTDTEIARIVNRPYLGTFYNG